MPNTLLKSSLQLNNEEYQIIPLDNPQLKNNYQPWYKSGLRNIIKYSFDNFKNETYITSNGKRLIIDNYSHDYYSYIKDENGNILHIFNKLGIKTKINPKGFSDCYISDNKLQCLKVIDSNLINYYDYINNPQLETTIRIPNYLFSNAFYIRNSDPNGYKYIVSLKQFIYGSTVYFTIEQNGTKQQQTSLFTIRFWNQYGTATSAPDDLVINCTTTSNNPLFHLHPERWVPNSTKSIYTYVVGNDEIVETNNYFVVTCLSSKIAENYSKKIARFFLGDGNEVEPPENHASLNVWSNENPYEVNTPYSWVFVKEDGTISQDIINGSIDFNNAWCMYNNGTYLLINQGNPENTIFSWDGISNSFNTSIVGKYITRIDSYQNNFWLITSEQSGKLLATIPPLGGNILYATDTSDNQIAAPGFVSASQGLYHFKNDWVTGSNYLNKKYNLSNIHETQRKDWYKKMANSCIDIRSNIRVIYNQGVQQAISWFNTSNTEEYIGTLLTYLSGISGSWPVETDINNQQMILYKDSNGNFVFMEIGIPENRFIKIHDKLYKINTVDTKNLMYEDIDLSFEYGSLDWNNRIYINPSGFNDTSGGTQNTTVPISWNSGYNCNYEALGGLFHSISFAGNNQNFSFNSKADTVSWNPNYSNMFGLFSENGISYTRASNLDNSNSLDLYIGYNPNSPEYIGSFNIIDMEKRYFNSRLENIIFPMPNLSSISTPLPIIFETEDTSNVNSLVRLGENQQAFLMQYKNYPMDSFYITSILYRNYLSFTILGTTYLYDGKYIFLMNRQGTITLNLVEICKAFNYKFLGNSYTEAYFYNTFDKSVHIFAGDRRLIPLYEVSNKPEILFSKFSTNDGQLYMMLTPESEVAEILILKDGQIYNYKYTVDKNNLLFQKFIETSEGCWMHSVHTNVLLRLESDKKYPEDPIYMPFYFETEHLGIASGTDSNLSDIVIQIYAEIIEDKIIYLNVETISSDSKKSDDKIFFIKKEEFDFSGHKNIKIIPKYPKGQAHKLTISSNNRIKITDIEWNTSQFARLPVRGNHSL